MPLFRQPPAKLGQQAGNRQGALQGKVQKEAKSDIDLRFGNDFPVGEPVVELQELQLDQAHRILGPAAHVRAVAVLNQCPELLKVDVGFDLTQVMIGRNQAPKDELVDFCRFDVVALFQHFPIVSGMG